MKPLVAIFAHPDDEAFGPSGFIALEAKKRDVYLICVTDGEAGINSSKSNEKLSLIRKKELQDSAKILGVKEVFFLNYDDGSLSNSLYHEVAGKIEEKLKEINPDTLLTYEPRGVSGHLDHIAVSFITTYVFNKMRGIKTLLYYCANEREAHNFSNDYFIYFPHGYSEKDVDLSEDVSSVWQQKIDSMKAHKSQRHDFEKIIKILNHLPKKEYFIEFK